MELERVSRMKDEFLATLSHELRTPLNAILGWTRLLLYGKADDPELVGEAIDVIDRNARLQTQLIEDLLDMAKPDYFRQQRSGWRCSRCDLRAVVGAALEGGADGGGGEEDTAGEDGWIRGSGRRSMGMRGGCSRCCGIC